MATEVKAPPTHLSVVTAEDIQRQPPKRVDQLFRGQVPGTIVPGTRAPFDNLSPVVVR